MSRTAAAAATLQGEMEQSARESLLAATKPFEPILQAQHLGSGFLRDGSYEVVLNYYRWHVRLRWTRTTGVLSSKAQLALLSEIRDARGALGPIGAAVHGWRPVEKVIVQDRAVTVEDVRDLLQRTWGNFVHRPEIVRWTLDRRPY